MTDTFFTRSGSSPGKAVPVPPDFLVENHFSLFLLFPRSDAAKIWCDEHLPADRMTWGSGIVIECRYVWPLLEGIQNDGLVAVPR
jgi:hypothetical protein